MTEDTRLLPDPDTARPRFRVDRLLREGRNYDLAIGTDLTDDGLVVIKSSSTPPDADAEARRAALDREMAAMESVSPHLPMPVALVDAPDDDTGASEPLLVYRFVEGRSLREHVAARGGHLEYAEALAIAHDVAAALDALHEHGWVHRAIAPEHVVIDSDGVAHVVGLGNAVRRETRPDPDRAWVVTGYSAPEIVREASGRMITPRADAWGLGALMAWLVSGDDPTDDPNDPWTRRTRQRLDEVPEGYALLVAHMTQPLHKLRFARLGRYRALMVPDALPSASTRDFGQVALAAPWRGHRPDAGRIGELSPGPLVNRQVAATNTPDPPVGSDAPTEGPRRARIALVVVSAVIVLVALISLLRQV